MGDVNTIRRPVRRPVDRRSQRHSGGTVQDRIEAARLRRAGLSSAPEVRIFPDKPEPTAEPEVPRRWEKPRRRWLLAGLLAGLLVALGGIAMLEVPAIESPDSDLALLPVEIEPAPTEEVVATQPAPADTPLSDTPPAVLASATPALTAPIPDTEPVLSQRVPSIVFRLVPDRPIATASADVVPAVAGPPVATVQPAALVQEAPRPDPAVIGARPAPRPVSALPEAEVPEASEPPVAAAPEIIEEPVDPGPEPELVAALPEVTPVEPPLPPASTAAVVLHLPQDYSAAQSDGILAALTATGHAPERVERFAFPVRSTQVRYFHGADADEATRLGTGLGAKVRDFTWFEPKPEAGQIEVWIAR